MWKKSKLCDIESELQSCREQNMAIGLAYRRNIQVLHSSTRYFPNMRPGAITIH